MLVLYYCREGPGDTVPYSVKHVKKKLRAVNNDNLPLQIPTCMLLKTKDRERAGVWPVE